MKANKAPEKIWMSDDTEAIWVTNPYSTRFIEYTRTDAFIEKACDAYCKVCGHYHHTTPNHICRQACDYYKDFISYMKGE